jgi:type II secretory pathway component PulF
VRSATSYAVVLLLSFGPAMVSVATTLFVFVLPRFREIFDGMGLEPTPWFQFITQHPHWVIGPQIALFGVLLLAAFFYIGGPRVAGWLQLGIFPVADWVAWRLPWKRHRLQRTFSVMLSTMLDGGMPEAEAVRLAADCTANEIVRRRAARVLAALARGVKLTEAIAAVDAHGEFRWRLNNAAHSSAGGFLRALNGWHASLDARAFREEQTAAHLTTSGLVILNGLLVTTIALGTFGSIVSLIEVGVLW